MPITPAPNLQKIGINALTSVAQVIVVGLVYFFLYKFLLHQLGAAMLGIWSLVLATASLATMANLGITAGLVKFVADINAKGEKEGLHTLLFTAFITMSVFFGVLVVLLYFILVLLLPKIVAHDYLAVAIKMLPYSLFSLFTNEIGGVFTSVLDGFQKNYRKNIIYIASSVLMLVAGYCLVPKFGIIGMAYAQAGQSVFVACSAFITSLKLIDLGSFLRSRWNKTAFKQMFSYGLKFQFISVCQMLYEPTTKALLSKFGGLSLVGFYEMASRLVSQVKSLLVNANQVMVPVIAAAIHNNKEEINKIYKSTFDVIMLICVPLISALVVFAPTISMLWVGRYEAEFINSIYLLCVGTFFNIICGPAYFGFMGEGKLGGLLKAHFFMAIANIVLGVLAGFWLKGYGIIAMWGIVLASGSILVMQDYHKHNNILNRQLFTPKTWYLLLSMAGAVILIKILFALFGTVALVWQIAIQLIIMIGTLAPFIYTHQYIKRLTSGRLTGK